MTPETPNAAAYREASRVVGLYGDPTISWSIVLRAALRRPVDPDLVRSRLARMTGDHPHLGDPPHVTVVGPGELQAATAAVANRGYAVNEPLVRVVVAERGRELTVGVHHGAADGLGMLAIVGSALGAELTSTARGTWGTAPSTGFVRSALGRLREAALHPPQRFRPVRAGADAPAGGDWLEAVDVRGRMSTAVLVAAVRRSISLWNASAPRHHRNRPVTLAIGASRRPVGSLPAPNRRTAYLRLVAVPHGITLDDAKGLVGRTTPEPDFPVTTGLGVGPVVTRVLGSRLGSSALLSNLGEVRGADDLESLAFYPAPGGPSAVGVGLVSVARRSTLTVRAARAAFSAAAAHELADLVAAEVSAVAAGQ